MHGDSGGLFLRLLKRRKVDAVADLRGVVFLPLLFLLSEEEKEGNGRHSAWELLSSFLSFLSSFFPPSG